MTLHFSKTTADDYVEAAIKKVCKIHKQLPPGGILVFLTGKFQKHSLGRAEILYAISRLKMELKKRRRGSESEEEKETPQKIKILPLYAMLSTEQQQEVFAPLNDSTRLIVISTNIAETSLTIPGVRYVVDTGRRKLKDYNARLSLSQYKVTLVSKAAADQRSGRAGRTGPGHAYRLYSSAAYGTFEDFDVPAIQRQPLDQTILQLKNLGISDVMKFPYVTRPSNMGLMNALKGLYILGAVEPRVPSKRELERYEDAMMLQRQLDADCDFIDTSVITKLGKILCSLAISPAYGKIIVLGLKSDCLLLAIVMVACLAVEELFIGSIGGGEEVIEKESSDEQFSSESDEYDSIKVQELLVRKKKKAEGRKDELRRRRHEAKKVHSKWGGENTGSDVLCEARCVGAYFHFKRVAGLCSQAAQERFCRENYVYRKTLSEIELLCEMLLEQIKKTMHKFEGLTFGELKPPTKQQEAMLLQMLTGGLVMNVAMRCKVFDADGREIQVASSQ